MNSDDLPTMAQIRSQASKAVKLAVLMLGDRVPEFWIEAQARDFMRMGTKALEESLNRFDATKRYYPTEKPRKEHRG